MCTNRTYCTSTVKVKVKGTVHVLPWYVLQFTDACGTTCTVHTVYTRVPKPVQVEFYPQYLCTP